VYFGWWTVLALGILTLLGSGFVTYGFSAFFKPIAADLSLSRAATSLVASVVSFGHSFQGLLSGWAADRYSPKWIIMLGILCLVVGFIIMNFVGSFWALLVVWGLVLGSGQTIACTIPAGKAIINWFIRKSGIALSITFTFQLLSGLVLLPLVAWLITTQGWRITSIIAGVIIAVVGFPLTWFFVKQHRPEYYGLLPDGDKKREMVADINLTTDRTSVAGSNDEEGFTLKQTMRTRAFWLLIALLYIAGLTAPVISVHGIPFLTDMGMSPVQAAAMMSVWLTIAIPARVGAGFLVDRMKVRHLRYVLAATYVIQALGVTAFLATRSLSMIYVWFVLYGIGIGANFSALVPLEVRYFGRKAFGAIDGMRWLLYIPIGLIGPVYVGWVYDTSGSYMSVFVLFAILLAAAGVVACFMLPPQA
jgi:MFS family permease